MAEPLEKAITAKILKALELEGGYWRKIHGSPYQSGIPDIIGCYRGVFVAFEVKRPSTRANVTKAQEYAINTINANGGYASVVTSPDEAVEVLIRIEALVDSIPMDNRKT
jgi:Holliday junction resolvase